jgi:DNA-binding phage protein
MGRISILATGERERIVNNLNKQENKMNALELLNEKAQMEIFEEVKSYLIDYNIQSVAEIAEVCPATLYFWMDGTTQSPKLETVTKVAWALGYELRLGKITGKKGKKSHLRSV